MNRLLCRAGARAAVLVALVTVGLSLVPPSASATHLKPPTLRLADGGRITFTDCVPTCATGKVVNPPSRFYVDVGRRRLIAASADRVNILDVDTLVQLESIPLNAGTGFGPPPIYDVRRQRLVYGEDGNALAETQGCPNLPVGGVACPAGARRIKAISLAEYTVDASGARQPVVSEFTFPPAFNGQKVVSMVHDVPRDLLFVVTQARAHSVTPGSLEVWVHAIDASRLASPPPATPSTRGYLWSYQINGCGSAELHSLNQRRSFLGVGNSGDFLYLLCQDTIGNVGGDQRPSVHGAVVVDFNGVDPRIAGVAGNFTRSFHPFGAKFDTGFTFGDDAGDRVAAVVAGAGGQRLYVFDAAHRAWTGSVLLGNANVKGGVFDEATGRAYTLDDKLGVVVNDAAAAPTHQGGPVNVGVLPGQSHAPAFDPVTRRLFTLAKGDTFIDEKGQALGGTETNHMRVYEDRTAPYLEPPPEDPDAGTNDIDEAQATAVTYAGAGSAYGARAMLVGGTRATLVGSALTGDAVWNPTVPVVGGTVDNTDLQPEGGDRGLFLGRVVESQLTGSSESGTADAVAIGASLDAATAAEVDSKIGIPFARTGQTPPEGAQWEAIKQNIGELNESSCYDFGDKDDPREAAGPGSSVSCRRSDAVAASAASSEQMAGLPVQIGFASSNVKLKLDEKKGVVTEVTAIARGVHAALPGIGSISIGEVRSVARSWAKGRPGTADSELVTTISNASVIGPDGEGFTCEQCDPSTLTKAVEARFPMRVQLVPPRPATDEAITGSPGGAQAVVIKERYAAVSDLTINGDSQSEVPGLQLVFYNDGKDASRVIVQLAAVFAQSTYEIGDPVETIDVDPASLSLELLDEAGEPLAGGVFELREDASGGLDDCLPVADDDEATDDETTTTTTAEAGKDEEDDEDDLASTASGHDDPLGVLPHEDEDEPPAAASGDEADDEGDVTDACAPVAEDESADEDESTTTTTTTPGGSTTTTTTTAASKARDNSTTTTTTEPERDDDETDADAVDELTDALVPNGSCVTDEDGVGDCVFEDLAPGSYIISQTTAPAGYAPVEDFPVTLTSGMASTVSFTNLKALASITLSLTDDATPPAPLAGGVFVIVADDADGVLGAADVELGTCTTGADGTCEPFEDVPLGAYVVHQESAPNGLLPAADVAFTLDQPGQVAALTFVNGLPPAAPAAVDTGAPASVEPPPAPPSSPSYGRTTYIPPPPPPAPVVSSTPIPDPPRGLGRVLSLPTEAASFLARNPGEAALFAAVWSLLLAPAYLAARRRRLLFVKEI